MVSFKNHEYCGFVPPPVCEERKVTSWPGQIPELGAMDMVGVSYGKTSIGIILEDAVGDVTQAELEVIVKLTTSPETKVLVINVLPVPCGAGTAVPPINH